MFQHTATRRWLAAGFALYDGSDDVSTHSHPKVAGFYGRVLMPLDNVSTHSHPKVAGYGL